MEQKDIRHWSGVLSRARQNAAPIPQLSHQMEALNQKWNRADAYSIQEMGIEDRFNAGERQVGYKMGLTSEAKRRQMNLDSPLYGVLTDKMSVPCASTFSLRSTIHPKIEPEIAFLITRDLPANPTRDEVLQSTGGICAALEILDSRYEQFKYFSLEDVIADNSSSSHFILGDWKKDFESLDLKNLSMKMFVGSQLAQEGSSRDISGDPVVSVIELCQLLGERKLRVRANSVVLAGAATTAVALEAGMQIRLEVMNLPSVSVQIENNGQHR